MPFETYKDLTGAGLRPTTYGPGSPNATRADLKEFIGLNDQRLRSGDAGLPRNIARRYGLNVGDPFQFGGKTYTYRDQPNTKVGNVIDIYHPASNTAAPDTGVDNPFAGGYPAQGTQSSSGETTDNPFAGGYPTSVPDAVQPIGGIDLPPIGAQEPTTAPYNVAYEGGPGPWNVPTNETMTPIGSDQYFPSEGGNIPTPEYMQPTGPDQYISTAPANVPTNEGMMPTGPNDFLPSAGADIPTNEAMYPTDLQQYLPSDAGANIPTNEDMTATLAPDAFGMSEAPATFAYPAGDGTYTTLDAATGQPASAPAQPVFDVNTNATGPLYGDQKKPTTFFQDLGADVTDITNAFGTSTPYNTALSGEPGFGGHPSSYTGPGGGAFWSPPGGSIGGPLGTGSAGQLYYDWFARMAKARMQRGQDPTLGMGRPGSAGSDFAVAAQGQGARGRAQQAMIGAPIVNPAYLNPPTPESSSRKPGGGAGLTTGGGPGGIA